MTNWVDVNVFVGQYPFRRLTTSTAETSAARLRNAGFSTAFVSSLEAVFEEDSYAAEAELATALTAHPGLLHFKTVNPAFSWWRRDAERAMDQFDIRGLRLCRPYHDYALTGPEILDVMRFASDAGLPVQILCRMQDYRIQWMLFGRDADGTEARAFVESLGTSQPVLICGLHFGEILALSEAARDRPNILFDTSRLRGPWRTFEKLTAGIDADRIAFGSLWPINLPECPLEQIRHAALSAEARSNILGGNARRLLSLSDDD